MKGVPVKPWMFSAFLAASLPLTGEVPELEKLVQETIGCERPCSSKPELVRKGDAGARSAEWKAHLQKKIGDLLKMTDPNRRMQWRDAWLDPFTRKPACSGIPTRPKNFIQTDLSDQKIRSNPPKRKNGMLEKGNVEFRHGGSRRADAMEIPGVPDRFRNSGIRSNRPPGAGGEFADGSFSKSAASLRGAELLVAGKPGTPEKSASREQDCSNAEIRGKTAKGFYSPGEEILFHLSVRNVSGLSQENPLTLLWTRKGDDGRTLQGKERITSDLPVAIRTRMDKPGFVWIHAVLADENGKPLSPGKKGGITFDGGAGVDVGKLTSGPEPEAFDKFWERQRRRLAAVPMGIPEMTKVSRAGDPMDVYAVRIPCAGARPVTGYVRIPRNAEPKSQKVLIWYHGYGVSPHTPNWKPVPYIEISINAHGFELGKEKTYYQNFEKSIRSGGKRYAFDPEQNRDPERAYFNGMALRVMRSLEFARTLSQWNGRDLTVFGASQGGMQAIWAAAMESGVSRCEIEVPWCCDLAGAGRFGRISGWHPAYVPALEYYDPVHFAARIPSSCKVVIRRVGLGDYTCPPSGISVFYNKVTAPKEIRYYQGSTHTFVPEKPDIFPFESTSERGAGK